MLRAITRKSLFFNPQVYSLPTYPKEPGALPHRPGTFVRPVAQSGSAAPCVGSCPSRLLPHDTHNAAPDSGEAYAELYLAGITRLRHYSWHNLRLIDSVGQSTLHKAGKLW